LHKHFLYYRQITPFVRIRFLMYVVIQVDALIYSRDIDSQTLCPKHGPFTAYTYQCYLLEH